MRPRRRKFVWVQQPSRLTTEDTRMNILTAGRCSLNLALCAEISERPIQLLGHVHSTALAVLRCRHAKVRMIR